MKLCVHLAWPHEMQLCVHLAWPHAADSTQLTARHTPGGIIKHTPDAIIRASIMLGLHPSTQISFLPPQFAL